jgi:hypothetical protein
MRWPAYPAAPDRHVIADDTLVAHPDLFQHPPRGDVVRAGRGLDAVQSEQREAQPQQRPRRTGGEPAALPVGMDRVADLAPAVLPAEHGQGARADQTRIRG